jgi:Domain of unknown function (DUF397)
MTGEPVSGLAWRKGRCDGGACVEVAAHGDEVMVRSTADPDATFRMSFHEWQEFLAGAKEGLFDELTR